MSPKYPKYLLCLAFCVGYAALASGLALVAQKTETKSIASEEMLRRKAELRAALKTQKTIPEPALPTQEKPVPAGRLLSDQERANLRRQIRQQHP